MDELEVQSTTHSGTLHSTQYRLRWWSLVVLSFSLIIVVIDTTVLNVSIPTLQRELNASASELQWIVDSYILVLAGVLLTMGALGDRFGRKRALQAGLVVFGLSSLIAAYSQTSGQLIMARAAMGIGAALITPATLAIVVDIFPREERGKAIGIWTAVAGLGIAVGPVLGGYLLEHFWWGSIFLINIPIVLFALTVGLFLVPESRNPNAARIDIPGAVLSTGALSILVYAIIEGPSLGWFHPATMGTFIGAILFGIAFVIYSLRAENPMLDVRFFTNSSFSAGSVALAVSFMALIGMAFILTQYLQVVRAYTPFEAGIRITPVALGMMVGSAISNRLVTTLGTKRVVSLGLLVVASMLVSMSLLDSGTAYWRIGIALFFLGFGMGNTLAPATTAIMHAVPVAKAGVGSAVATTSRQIGMALGVGILGSVLNSVYSSNISVALGGLSAEASVAARNSVNDATQIAASIGGHLAKRATQGS